MGRETFQPPEPTLNGGDRVHIRQGPRVRPMFVGRVGTVIEVFRMPLDSCLVRLDGDPDRRREWFFYRDEITIDDPH